MCDDQLFYGNYLRNDLRTVTNSTNYGKQIRPYIQLAELVEKKDYRVNLAIQNNIALDGTHSK